MRAATSISAVVAVLLLTAFASAAVPVRHNYKVSACRSLSGSCSSCLQDPQCGWCNTDQDCVPGTWAGPNVGQCPSWSFENCSAAPTPPAPSTTSATSAVTTATPYPPPPTINPPPPPAGPALVIGSFMNLSPGPVYLQFQSTATGEVCATTPAIPTLTDFEWYTLAPSAGADAQTIKIDNCSNIQMITVFSANGTSLYRWGMYSSDSPISILDLGYFGPGIQLAGAESWGNGPLLANETWINVDGMTFNGTGEAAATWYTNVSAPILMTFYNAGHQQSCWSETLQGPNAIRTWRVGQVGAACTKLGTLNLETDAISCNITWPTNYAWSGASLYVAPSTANAAGWCLASNFWASNATGFTASPTTTCPVCGWS